MEPLVLFGLVVAAFVAAFFDSIVGGGGVVSLPALLAAGLPPHLALGTNKLAATGASFTATARYTHAGLVKPGLARVLVPFAGVGGFGGAILALKLDGGHIRALVLVVMALMTVYVLAHPSFGKDPQARRRPTTMLAAMVGLAFAIGFYDGVLGPGTGTFLIFGFVGVLGFDFLSAAAHGRVLNFASNLGALVLFALQGFVDYSVGLPMLAAMVAGGWVGSHVGLRHGRRWVRPLFVVVTGGLMVRLGFVLWG